MGYVKKRREECVLFLDEGFSADSIASALRAAGFIVEQFPHWFKDSNGITERNVPDGRVIAFCDKRGWLLVTTDHEMKCMHLDEITKTQVSILATAHNSAEDPAEWVKAIISLKARIHREFKNRERPWFATFSREAKLHIVTITPRS